MNLNKKLMVIASVYGVVVGSLAAYKAWEQSQAPLAKLIEQAQGLADSLHQVLDQDVQDGTWDEESTRIHELYEYLNEWLTSLANNAVVDRKE